MGGAVATAVAACTELEALPLSFRAVQKILSNLSKCPDEVKYRRLRLENPAVRKYCDLDPVLRILTSIGFVRKEEERVVEEGSQTDKPPVEQVLVLEGDVDVGQIKELLEILDGLSSENNVDRTKVEEANVKKNDDGSTGNASSEGKEESDIADDGGTCTNGTSLSLVLFHVTTRRIGRKAPQGGSFATPATTLSVRFAPPPLASSFRTCSTAPRAVVPVSRRPPRWAEPSPRPLRPAPSWRLCPYLSGRCRRYCRI